MLNLQVTRHKTIATIYGTRFSKPAIFVPISDANNRYSKRLRRLSQMVTWWQVGACGASERRCRAVSLHGRRPCCDTFSSLATNFLEQKIVFEYFWWWNEGEGTWRAVHRSRMLPETNFKSPSETKNLKAVKTNSTKRSQNSDGIIELFIIYLFFSSRGNLIGLKEFLLNVIAKATNVYAICKCTLEEHLHSTSNFLLEERNKRQKCEEIIRKAWKSLSIDVFGNLRSEDTQDGSGRRRFCKGKARKKPQKIFFR